MPLYEYRCKKCGTSFEVIQKVNEEPLKECVRCGGLLEKVLSPPALQFKGHGWYVTDYAQKAKTGKDEKPADDKQKDKKTESSKDDKKTSSSSE